ncbi:MAG: Acetyltransferase [Bacteroidetes bacterium]|jgi:acetyltransferase-like isoleucine patch superfamily enzyme|nr:Acetyltransferase [Bacteroidota bacterium]
MEILNVDEPRKSLVNVKVGQGVRIFNFVNAYGCSIDDNSKVGAFVEIQKGATIGKNCKISSHTFICEGVHIEDNVFIGHGVMFTNDLFPRATNPDGSAQTEADWKLIETFVKKGASIGSNATILCGITIGENALIGAGAVVTKDVPANTVVAGNPGKVIKNL